MFPATLPTERLRRLSPGPLGALALAALLATGAARAQVAIEQPAGMPTGEEPLGAEGPPPRVWIEPRVFARQWYSSNYGLAASDPQSEWTTELGASVMAVFNTPRLVGSVDYSLSGLYQARGVGEDDHLQGLTADLLVDAWDKTAFVELTGNIGRARISAFDVQPAGDLDRPNLAETKQFRVSPFLRGTLSNAYDYELRYSRFTSRTEADTRADIDENDVLARIGTAAVLDARLGWTAEYTRSQIDYSLGREVQLSQLVGMLNYALTPTLSLQLRGGRESNDVLTTETESYSTWGGGFNWRPQPNLSVAASGNKRFFGHDHLVQVQYQMRRAVLRYTDSRNVSNSQVGLTDGQNTLAGLLDALYLGRGVTNPVERAPLVQGELDRLGLPGDLTTLPGFLTSYLTEERIRELALVIQTGRGAFTAALYRNLSRRLDTSTSATFGDDFDLSDQIQRKGWTLGYAHRITARTAASIAVQRQENVGVGTVLRNQLDTLTLAMTTRLSPRTTGSLLWRRAVFDAPSPYRETAVQAVLSHSF